MEHIDNIVAGPVEPPKKAARRAELWIEGKDLEAKLWKELFYTRAILQNYAPELTKKDIAEFEKRIEAARAMVLAEWDEYISDVVSFLKNK